MTEKAEYFNFTSPRVVVRYPKLLTPDTGPRETPTKPAYKVRGMFKPGEGKFTVAKVATSYEEVLAKLEEMRDAFFLEKQAEAKAKKNGKLLKALHKADVFNAEVDEEGAETGVLSFTAKTAAEYTDKKTKEIVKRKPPTIFDAAGKVISKPPAIGGGSEMKIAVSVKPYIVESSGAVGISFYLEGTQLLKLVQYQGKSADSLGFGAEAGGYTDESVDESGGFKDESGGEEANVPADENEDF